MLIDSGRAPARDAAVARTRRTAVARVRGASAGAVSGALSIAAHGWASGGMSLDTTTAALLVVACTAVGALVAGVGPLRHTLAGLAGALVGGQLLGHAVLSFGMAGMHHGESVWSPAMLLAHIVAAVCAALVIRAAEAAYRVVTGILARALPALLRSPAVAGPPLLRTTHRSRVILRVFAADTFRTRGPPQPVRV
ncbi:hypothetical protein BJY24_000925 [Nocardia transvalensis]|uniref:Uncharacterized protein n=1 Tax=Nocardia transvalensis TaxID=37333 RepID=A0A7W9PAA8_9NOCA|nr:hypothetical protein [Nocardia transvalensis]MBB5912058.1 hypothetical protein [Nocardia transvalensis]